MKLLSIDASESPLSIAAKSEKDTVCHVATSWKESSESIIPLIQRSLKDIDLSIADLDAIAISNGPGSFTGLRVANATVKGISFVTQVPVLKIATLEAMLYYAHLVSGSYSQVAALILSRRDIYYYAHADVRAIKRLDFSTMKKGIVLQKDVKKKIHQSTFLVSRHYLDANNSCFSARELMLLAEKKFDHDELCDASNVEPDYHLPEDRWE